MLNEIIESPSASRGQKVKQANYDFIIVGAGSAGCVVARRLIEIQPNFLLEEIDFEAMVNAVELCMNLVAEPELAKIINTWIAPPEKLDRQKIRDFVKDSCSTYFHPVGTSAPWGKEGMPLLIAG